MNQDATKEEILLLQRLAVAEEDYDIAISLLKLAAHLQKDGELLKRHRVILRNARSRYALGAHPAQEHQKKLEERALGMWKSGMPIREVAKDLSVSKTTAWRMADRALRRSVRIISMEGSPPNA